MRCPAFPPLLRADGGIRTPDQLITNQLLWPTELHRHGFRGDKNSDKILMCKKKAQKNVAYLKMQRTVFFPFRPRGIPAFFAGPCEEENSPAKVRQFFRIKNNGRLFSAQTVVSEALRWRTRRFGTGMMGKEAFGRRRYRLRFEQSGCANVYILLQILSVCTIIAGDCCI